MLLTDGWAEGWRDGGMGGRCVRYGWIGGRRNGWMAGWVGGRRDRERREGGSIGAVTYEAKTKRENLLRNLHRRKKKIIIIYL